MKLSSNSTIKSILLASSLSLASSLLYANTMSEEVNADYCVKAAKIEVCTSEGSMTAYNGSDSTKVILITGENYESGFKVKLKPKEKRYFKTKITSYIDADIEFKIIDDFSKT